MRIRALALAIGVVALAGVMSLVIPVAAAEQPSHAQLAIMVLPKQVLGPAAQSFLVDIGSGVVDNAARAEDTDDPSDTGQQLARRGRITGYDLSYSDQSALSLVRGSGLLSISSSVDLFESTKAADAFLTKQVRDALRLRGRYLDGLRLVASSTFAVGKIGDRGVGLRETGQVGDRRISRTVVGLRVGTLVAGVAVDRADPRPATESALRLAHTLAARVRLAAAGRLRAEPMPVPPVGRKGQRPPGGIDLGSMALTLRDLPKGTTLVRQGYVTDRSTIGTYEREFDTSSARIGPDMVETDVSLFRNATEAGGFFRVVRLLVTSSTVERDWVEAFEEPDLRVERVGPVAAGHESIALVFRFPAMGLVPTRVAIIHVRVGRAVGTLLVAGVAQKFGFDDAKPLAGTFAQRLRDGL